MSDEIEPKETISSAFLNLLGAIRNAFRLKREYRQVYLHELIYREETDHLQRMADKFADRGRGLRRVAWLTLGVSLVLIVVGISIFLIPTRFTQTDLAREEIDEASEERSVTLIEAAEVEVQYLAARDLYNLFGIFHELYGYLDLSYQPAENLTGSELRKRRLRYARGASNQFLLSSPVSKRYTLTGFQYHDYETGIISVPAEVFNEAANRINASGGDTALLAEAFDKLDDAIGSNEQDQAVLRIKRELKPLEVLYSSATQDMENLYLALDEDAKGRVDSTRQLLAAEKRISDALLRINEAKSGWANQPWVTLLSVRIGIIVLLLYLTTVLLATYRYTLTLSAYYFARADALQLLSGQPEDRLFDFAELVALIPMLSPDNYRVDHVKTPYEAIGEATRGG